ncbi:MULTISPECIES: cupin domain-containing protein [Streptomyces]|uniref:Cupin domain-containing protein n=1 Tax=Streptomyces venezuelae TaxID=54571 RepID=A0A5P2BLL0_STRVZ|nr:MULTISPECIES: cupin domain-containing protein [Streptomyces]NEA05746.1 cupin domain-containing protein [Streptomyces sp. SID10116]MYY82907.1 cupin domain-containing protein [Streptomyces sp. SID335]NDZ88672.1 cupin domain-containing protein [Streptomyces sp. SID10115]NEB47543.1 cupin domain-containing protein [Streptomyces sp. SID339]QES31263.1 cupin domain-containing protein [Streptomyces venezuelae]
MAEDAAATATGRGRPVNVRDLLTAKEHDHGGLGTILAHRIFARAEGSAGADFIDLAVLPPGASIGRHRHGADRETYVVLAGSGLMFRDGEEFRVGAGDVVVNRPHGEHGLLNDSADATDLHLLVFEVSEISEEAVREDEGS